MDWILKAALGAVAVMIIQLFAQSKNYYLAGLVPLFPTFTLISHYLVGTQRCAAELKLTICFGILSLIPYLCYMITLYFLVDRFRLSAALVGATMVWIVSAAALIAIWSRA